VSSSVSGGPPLRAIAMVLIAFAILFGGLGAFSLSGPSTSNTADTAATSSGAETSSLSSSSTAPSSTAQSATASAQAGAGIAAPSSTAKAGPVDKSLAVEVLNNGVVAGLARRTAQRLEAHGWTNVTSGNYSAADLTDNTVLYDDSSSAQQAAANALATELRASVEPKSSGPRGLPPGLVVLVVTAG
jgi:cytoskeletal protein RodZ